VSFFASRSGLAALVVAISVFAASFLAYQVRGSLQPAASVSLNLRDGETEVPLNQQLVFQVAHPTPGAKLEAALRIRPDVQGHLDAKSGTEFTWTPRVPWSDQTTYTVEVRALTDSAGRRINGGQWKFTTTVVPRVVAVVGEGGAVLTGNSNVEVGKAMTVTFNAPMDPASVRLLANGAPQDLKWAADARSASMALTPQQAGVVRLSLGPGGHDRSGHPLSTGWTLTVISASQPQPTPSGLPFPALVQVPNDINARDQSGLQSAMAVFEYLTEAGIPRFTAMFARAPDTVGPVESGRFVSLGLTRHFRGELFMSDLGPAETARLRANPVPTWPAVNGLYFRSAARRAPDNLYIRGGSIDQVEKGASTPPFTVPVGAGLPPGKQPAGSVSVPELYSTYNYDQQSDSYNKIEGGRALGDALTSQPLRIQLVIVMHTKETLTSAIESGYRSQTVDYDVDSGGAAEFYYHGRMSTGRWSGSDTHNPFAFQLDDGTPVQLTQGLNWIELTR
jgi:hypothetical protein